MFEILACLRDQHDWRLVFLAALVCVASSFTAIILTRRAQKTEGRERLLWVLTAGATAGFGIWATHFIAMMAYDPGVVASYDLLRTLMSLAVAVMITAAGIAMAATEGQCFWRAIGGALVGLGVAGMHYTGMSALDIPAYIQWSQSHVAASVLLGMGLSAAALSLATSQRKHALWLGAGLLVLAIVTHHFTGMGAITLIADPTRQISGVNLSPDSMSLTIAAVALAVLGLAAVTVLYRQKLEAAVAENERHFRVLVDSIQDYAIYMLDPEGRVSNWNSGAQRFKGYSAEEIVGKNFAVFYPLPQQRAGKPERALAIARDTGRFEEEAQRVRKDGTTFYAHVVITPIFETGGRLIGFAKITRDVTQRKADTERLRQTTRNLDAALRHMSQGLCLYDAEERLILANPRVFDIFGTTPAEAPLGISFHQQLTRVMRGAGATEAQIEARYQVHRALIEQNGGVLISEFASGQILSISHQPMPDGGWVTTFDDITERRRDEARLAHMARHDGLTGLANREHFNQYLDNELEWAPRNGQKVAVLAIDLNRFKEINDLRGHAAGDEVLRTVADRLKGVCDEGEFAARVGGDEFACIKRFADARDLDDFIGHIGDALHGRIDLDGYEIYTGGSVGVAIYPDDAAGREALMNNADLALYRAKANHSENVCFYEARMDEAARDRRAMAKDLWQAPARGELSVHYQVQKSVTTHEITGYEALLRWKHPERGSVSPVDFIPVAEECGAILDIGEWVLRTACAEAATWDNKAKIAVNLSPVQFGHNDLVQMVHSILIETGLSPRRLELEITESTIIGDKTRALHILRQIKALGVTIAIDDFGTGYSSLDTLNAFPFDKIKIDRSFLMDAEQSPQARAIIRAILALGKSLDVPVLAEGVETISQLELLQSEGCDEAQGYYFGRPAPYVEVMPAPAQHSA